MTDQQQRTDPGDITQQQETQAEKILGKYNTPEDFDNAFGELVKHEKINMPELSGVEFADQDRKIAVYKQLSSLMGKPAPEATSLELGGGEQTQQQPQQQSQLGDPLTMQELVAGVGVKQDELNNLVMNGGALPQETAEKFKQAVIELPDGSRRPLDPSVVQQVLGSQAQGVQYQQVLLSQAADHVGGREQLNALMQFGGTLDPVTQQSINIELKNPGTMKSALDRLSAIYKSKIGAEGSSGIVSDTSGPGVNLSNKPFKNNAEKKAFANEHGEDSKIYQSRLLATPDSNLSNIA